jgi:hypothetical protein
MFLLNWVWWREIFQSDFVWRWFWNPEIRYFKALQPVFVKCLLCTLYWTRCKSSKVSFGFCSILSDFYMIFLLILNLYESYTTVNDSWLHNSNIFFSFAVILQVFAVPLRSEFLTYYKSLCKSCKSTAKTKHKAGIIKSAFFQSSLPFL